MNFAAQLKRIDALIANAERERHRAEGMMITFRATDFLTGSPWPSFARAAGDHLPKQHLLAVLRRAHGECESEHPGYCGAMVPRVSNKEGENGDEEAKSTTADAEEV